MPPDIELSTGYGVGIPVRFAVLQSNVHGFAQNGQSRLLLTETTLNNPLLARPLS
jgi:hypothetical protein